MQPLQQLHSSSFFHNIPSFSCGNLSSSLTESISTPQDVRLVAGPTLFWDAVGTPSLWPSESSVTSNLWQAEECGGATW